MNIDLSFLETGLVGTTVPRPLSGTLSGHAAGEPFDKHVYQLIKQRYPGQTYRQYEYLNKLYADHPEAITANLRWNLIKSPPLAYLLNRGKSVTDNWSPDNLLAEKQNDTADIIVEQEGFCNLLDVKTFNAAMNGQPPNIISAYKLAQMCALVLQNNDFNSLGIVYVYVAWQIDGQNLRCTKASVKQLFKAPPGQLYINWAAAMQIQFHVDSLDQSFSGNIEQWCRDYLKLFVASSRMRTQTMERKFIKPFETYL